jgi:hypothetical protein
MAHMMASGEVGLLLSPKYKLWQVCSSHVCPAIDWDQGLLAWFIFILFYILFSCRTSIGLIGFPPSPPVPSPSSTWLRSTSSSCDAFPCDAKMLLLWTRVRSSSSKVLERRSLTVIVVITSAIPHPHHHHRKSLPICFRPPPFRSLFLIGGGSLINVGSHDAALQVQRLPRG